MSFDRIWQYPYELNYPDNTRGQQIIGWSLDPVAVTTNDPFTGDRSIYDSGPTRLFIGHSWSPGIDDWRFGLAFKSNTSSTNEATLFLAYAAGEGATGTPSIDVRWIRDEMSLVMRVAGAEVDRISTVQSQYASVFERQYMHIGIHYLGGTSIDMWVNGHQVFNYVDAGVPTDIEFVGGFWSGPVGWHRYMVDDWYFDACAGEASVVPPGYRFLYSNTNADGTLQDWANKNGGDDYEEVDDTEIDDDDTYVWIGNSNSLEMFNTANITVPDGHNIVAAIPVAVARKGTAILASQLQMAVDNGVDAIDYSTAKDLNTWYYETWGRYLLDPAGAPWVEATFNSNEFGMRTQGTV